MAPLVSCTTARVVDNLDPESTGRVKVAYFAVNRDSQVETWARLSVPMAGDGRGFWFLPEVDDEVLLAFGRDEREAFVIGSLWNRIDSPPQHAQVGNARKLLRSRNGLQLIFEDIEGSERVVIETPAGQRVTLSDGPGAVLVEDANGNRVALEASGITITAAGKVDLAAAQVNVNASVVRIDAGMSKFSGVVQCDTLIANSVVSASYTPGAGNVR